MPLTYRLNCAILFVNSGCDSVTLVRMPKMHVEYIWEGWGAADQVKHVSVELYKTAISNLQPADWIQPAEPFDSTHRPGSSVAFSSREL